MTTEEARERAVELWRQGRDYASLIGGIADALLQVERQTAERCATLADGTLFDVSDSLVRSGSGVAAAIRREFGLEEK